LSADPLPVAPSAPIRILIAEDELHLGAILEQFLAARGHAVTRVCNGREALDRVHGGALDVALVDLVMPEVDGLEVLRQVRQLPSPPEVLVVSGNGTGETAMTALQLGAYDVLPKPYRMGHIDLVVRRAYAYRQLVLDHRRLQAQVAQVAQVAPVAQPVMVAPSIDASTDAEHALSLPALEQRHIRRVLEATSWHQGRAAEWLGISPKTLYRKIRALGLSRPGARGG
jgi:DNA-binding NtrC family response regulator